MGIFSRKPDIEKMREKFDLKGLIKASKHGDPKVRFSAIEALGEWFGSIKVATMFRLNAYGSEKGGDRLALRAILDALKDEDEEVRKIACFNVVFTMGVYERADELASGDLNEEDRKSISKIFKEFKEEFKRGMAREDCEVLDRGFSRIRGADYSSKTDRGTDIALMVSIPTEGLNSEQIEQNLRKKISLFCNEALRRYNSISLTFKEVTIFEKEPGKCTGKCTIITGLLDSGNALKLEKLLVDLLSEFGLSLGWEDI